jgi:hypothetical protein
MEEIWVKRNLRVGCPSTRLASPLGAILHPPHVAQHWVPHIIQHPRFDDGEVASPNTVRVGAYGTAANVDLVGRLVLGFARERSASVKEPGVWGAFMRRR